MASLKLRCPLEVPGQDPVKEGPAGAGHREDIWLPESYWSTGEDNSQDSFEVRADKTIVLVTMTLYHPHIKGMVHLIKSSSQSCIFRHAIK